MEGTVPFSSPNGAAAMKSAEFERDRAALARSGKKQVLQRFLARISKVSITDDVSVDLKIQCHCLLTNVHSGGPAGLIYGFIFVGLGWLTVAGWTAALASAMNFSTSLIQALAIQSNPSFSPTGWQGTLIYWAVLIFCVSVNTVLSKLLPAIEVMVLILHVMGFFAILIPLVYLSPTQNSTEIFKTFLNEGGWQSKGLAFFIGLNGNAGAFIGTDGPIHISEEVKNAAKNVPRSMVYSVILNGFLGLGILVAFLICADFEAAATRHAAVPFVPVLAAALGSNAGASVMTAIILILTIFAGVGVLASASRMTWSFARDHGLPGWRSLSQVHSKTTIPLKAIAVVAVATALLGLINIGSSTAFSDTLSLLLESLYTSYLLVCGLLLYRRLKGQIGNSMLSPTAEEFVKDVGFQHWGPWHVPSILGIINNGFACVYLIIICFFSFWPEDRKVTPANMNYSILVTGSVAVFSIAYYLARGRKTYNGPVVEIDPTWELREATFDRQHVRSK
ncbi:MAG: hypothetical protein Q9157_001228 [Trypethelium eluteriae]